MTLSREAGEQKLLCKQTDPGGACNMVQPCFTGGNVSASLDVTHNPPSLLFSPSQAGIITFRQTTIGIDIRMLLPTLLATTALALTANAFLVPLEIADKAKAATSAIANIIIPSTQIIKLDCSTCPLAESGAEEGLVHTWATSSPKTDLVMEFGTTADKKQITLNGIAFFPPTVSTMLHPLKAKQVLQPGEVVASDVKTYNGELGLSYSIEAQEQVVQEGATLVPITLMVLGLDGKMVNVDAITIPIIKTDNGDVSFTSLLPVSCLLFSPSRSLTLFSSPSLK